MSFASSILQPYNIVLFIVSVNLMKIGMKHPKHNIYIYREREREKERERKRVSE